VRRIVSFYYGRGENKFYLGGHYFTIPPMMDKELLLNDGEKKDLVKDKMTRVYKEAKAVIS
jgi:hypothetical protein